MRVPIKEIYYADFPINLLVKFTFRNELDLHNSWGKPLFNSTPQTRNTRDILEVSLLGFGSDMSLAGSCLNSCLNNQSWMVDKEELERTWALLVVRNVSYLFVVMASWIYTYIRAH